AALGSWISTSGDPRTRQRLADAPLQGVAALLESELPDDSCAGPDRAPVPPDLLACARIARVGFRRPGQLHRVPHSRTGHDVGLAERVRQQLVFADPVQD